MKKIIIVFVALLAVTSLLIAATPSGKVINLNLVPFPLDIDTMAAQAGEQTKERYGFDVATEKARLSMNLKLTNSGSEFQVSGNITLITPSQQANTIKVSPNEYLVSRMVNGQEIYYGTISGTVNNNIAVSEHVGAVIIYNVTTNKALVTLSTGTLNGDLSLLSFGDTEVIAIKPPKSI